MSNFVRKVILITGASSGIGRMCAEYLNYIGHRVYGTKLPHEDATSNTFELIPMNINDDDLVKKGIEHVMEREKRIDVVVNNAGFGIAGSIEDTSIEEAKMQMETNFFGGLRICRQVLPIMREHRSGLIINVSSMAGVMSIPFQGLYSASKYAIEGYTEALRMEVSPFNINVVLIEPADFKTGFTKQRRFTKASHTNKAYRSDMVSAVGVMENDEQNGPTPERIAHLLSRIVQLPSPKLRYPVGPSAKTMVIPLKKILPQRVFEWAFMKYYRLR